MKKKQLLINIIANFLAVIISMLISFFLTPYIIGTIGKEAYSYIPISSNFLSYLGIFTVAITSMTSRFVSLEYNRKDIEKSASYFSTAFYSGLVGAIIILIITIITILNLDHILNISSKLSTDVRLLFLFMFLSFSFNILTIVYAVPAFCLNRLDITNVVSICGSVIRILLVVVLFKYFEPKVFYIGLITLSVTFIQGSLNYHFSKKILPALKISYKKVKLKIAIELFSSGIWNSFSQFSSVLLTGTDLLIANIMISESASGILAVAKTVPIALQTLASVLPTTFYPYLTILYSEGNQVKFMRELQSSLKFTAIIIGIPIAGYIAIGRIFFGLWVPSIVSTQLVTLSILTMLPMLVSFSISPLIYVYAITNKLKLPSVIMCVSGFLNILIVVILIRTTNNGLIAIAGISSLFEIIRYFFFVPFYAAYCLGEKKTVFYPILMKSIIYVFALIFIFSFIIKIFSTYNWMKLIGVVLIMVFTGLAFGVSFMTSNTEKKQIWDLLLRTIHVI